MPDRSESIILSFEVDLEDSIVNIGKLEKANKALREERKKVNLESAEGQKRVREINATLDQNTNKIKNNVSALEQQKINIGNYRSALDGITPGLGKFAEGLQAGTKGFKAMTLQALAFIATPIGLVIAAVGAALFALTSYFKGSEEGQNALNKVVAVGSAIFEQFMNIVEAVGKIIFDAISNPKQALIDFGNLVKENIINRFTGMLELIPNIGKAIGLLFEGKFAQAGQVALDAVAKVTLGVADATSKINGFIDSTGKLIEVGRTNGEKLAALQAKIAKDERALTELRAKNDLEVSRLREQAVNLEGDARRKAIQEAIALEQGLSKKEVEFAKTKLALAALEVTANGDTTEALKAQSEAVANVSSAEKTAFDNTLKFRKELKKLDEDSNKLLEEKIALEQANKRAASKEVRSSKDGVERQDRKDPLIDAFETRAQVITDIDKRMNDDLVKRNKATDDEIIKNKVKSAELEKQIERAKLAFTADVLGSIGSLVEQDSQEGKIIASAQALINTYLAATAALASGSELNPIFGILSAAAAIAAGLASVAKINEVQFAEGGWTGPGGKFQARGVVHADEYVTPKWLVHSRQAQPHLSALETMRRRGYADGGLVVNGITQPINQSIELSNIFKNMAPMEISVKEVTTVQKRIKTRENISKR